MDIVNCDRKTGIQPAIAERRLRPRDDTPATTTFVRDGSRQCPATGRNLYGPPVFRLTRIPPSHRRSYRKAYEEMDSTPVTITGRFGLLEIESEPRRAPQKQEARKPRSSKIWLQRFKRPKKEQLSRPKSGCSGRSGRASGGECTKCG